MKRQLKRFFDWCPQPQAPNYRVLRQYSKPLLSMVMVGIIALSVYAVSTLSLIHAPTPPPITLPTATPTPTPTATPTMQPTANPKPSASPTPTQTFFPIPSPIPTPTPTPGPTWQIPNGTVDFPGLDGGSAYSSLALDASGNPHISFMDYHNALRYAVWNGTGWTGQIVDKPAAFDPGQSGSPSSAVVGLPSDIALDSRGYPHISYFNDTNYNKARTFYNKSLDFGDLKYAWWNGSSWNTQTVEFGTAGSLVGQYCSIAVGSDDKPRISYFESNNSDGNLKYARWTGTSWNIQTVDSKGDVGYRTSLALDSDGNPHISYLDKTNGDLKYASWSGTGWDIQVITQLSGDTSLALDSAGNPHISYVKGGSLMYTFWDGTSWNIQTVDSSFVDDCSLALDSYGNAHISYHGYDGAGTLGDPLGSVLKYAVWNGTVWRVIDLDTRDMAGYESSIALDSAGRVKISYFDISQYFPLYVTFG